MDMTLLDLYLLFDSLTNLFQFKDFWEVFDFADNPNCDKVYNHFSCFSIFIYKIKFNEFMPVSRMKNSSFSTIQESYK